MRLIAFLFTVLTCTYAPMAATVGQVEVTPNAGENREVDSLSRSYWYLTGHVRLNATKFDWISDFISTTPKLADRDSVLPRRIESDQIDWSNVEPLSIPLWQPPVDSSYRENRIVVYDPVSKSETTLPLPIASDAGQRLQPGFFGIIGGTDSTLNDEGSQGSDKNFNTLQPVLNPEDYPWRVNVKLFMRWGSSWHAASGVLVGPRHVLTAGHCVYKPEDGLGWADEVIAIPGYEDGNEPYGRGNNETMSTWTEWTENGNYDWDIAIISLDNYLGNQVGYHGYGYTSSDDYYTYTTFHNPGYPAEPPDFDGDTMFYWWGTYDTVFTHLLYFERFCYKGQSGSGSYKISDGNRSVHGVTSHRSSWEPPVPSWVNATDNYCDRVTITWQDVDHEDGYGVYRDGVVIAYTGADDCSAIDYVSPGTYSYHVHSYNSEGESDHSVDDQGTRATIPAQVIGVVASNGTNCDRTVITWNNVSNETGYKIYRSGSYIGLVGANVTSYSDYAGSCNVSYNYAIRAYNQCGDGLMSSSNLGWSICDPVQVTGVIASNGTYCDRAVITWNDLSGETTYKVYRNGSYIGSVGANVTTYSDYAGSCNISYDYSVRAINSCGDGPMSSSNSGWSICDPTQVTGVSATDDHVDNVVITWVDVSTETGYRVYRNGTQIGGDRPANSTSYTDTPAVGCYNYTVRAFNACGEGPLSVADEGCRVSCPTPPEVTGVLATDDNADNVVVTWSDVPYETGYRVYRNGIQIGGDRPTDSTAYTDAPAIGCYDYTVRAFNACGEGPLSADDEGCRVEPIDADGDGVSDDVDNCPDVFNPSQNDWNGDGIGDECDSNRGAISIDGEGTATVSIGSPVLFDIRMTNTTNRQMQGFSNGFRIYSPEGAEWTNTSGSWTGTLDSTHFDLVMSINPYGVTGTGADTIGFAASIMMGPGMPSDFDDVAFTIEIGPIDAAHVGKQICIDSCFYPPFNPWKWIVEPTKNLDLFPVWSGPYCFEVMDDVDSDGIPADVDNCPDVFNPSQNDWNGDGIGDECDSNRGAISIDGEGTATISIGSPVLFDIRMTNSTDRQMQGFSNGFRIYSPEGAEWTNTSGSWTGTLDDTHFDLVLSINPYGVTGTGSDTIGFAGSIMMGPGMPSDFDDVAFSIEIGPIDAAHVGKQICIDSCFYPPFNPWKWIVEPTKNLDLFPVWGGPYCYTIVPSCCTIRGDIDHNGTGPDIADLVYLVNYMFNGGPEPPCMEEADINGDAAGPDIADLVYLVNYMFNGGPPPVPCL